MQCTLRPEEGEGSPGIAVSGSCDLEIIHNPLPQQPVFLSAETSYHISFFHRFLQASVKLGKDKNFFGKCKKGLSRDPGEGKETNRLEKLSVKKSLLSASIFSF